MENTRPHQCIEFELRLLYRDSVDVKVEIKIATNSTQVVVDLLHLLVPAQYIDSVHLVLDDPIEVVNQFLPQQVGELVVREVSQALVEKP